MTLKEWWEQNQDKEVRIKEDGSISITKKGDRWTPKLEDRYWIVTHDGGSEWSTWEDDYTDKNRYAIGNIFETKEEADKTVEILKIRAQLKACGGKEVWEMNGKQSVTIFYDPELKELDTWSGSSPDAWAVCFDTHAQAQVAAEKVGKERIKKYLFGVEE